MNSGIDPPDVANNVAESLGLNLVSQDSLENDISKQANAAVLARDTELDEKRLEKASRLLNATVTTINRLQARLDNPKTKISARKQLRDDIVWFQENELQPRRRDVNEITLRLRDSRRASVSSESAVGVSGRLPDESERDFLIRTGKITAFGNQQGFKVDSTSAVASNVSHSNLRAPGFESPAHEKPCVNDVISYKSYPDETDLAKVINESLIDPRDSMVTSTNNEASEAESNHINDDIIDPSNVGVKDEATDLEDILSGGELSNSDDAYTRNNQDSPRDIEYVDEKAAPADEIDMEDEYHDDDDHDDEEEDVSYDESADKSEYNDPNLTASKSNQTADRNIDDGDERIYQKRLKEWTLQRSKHRLHSEDDSKLPEWRLPHPEIGDAVLDGDFRLPGDIYPSLFDYQKTGVQWLYELYTQKAGGIVGDEMGLGKTIQVISFLAGLHYLGLLDKPVLVVVPATVLNQWVNEFHRWWPAFRCVILHSIGLGMGKGKGKGKKDLEEYLESMLESETPDTDRTRSLTGLANHANAQAIINTVMLKGHVLVTTYVGVRVYAKYILPHQWGYCILDEGHKIRNPDLEMSLTCKQIKTCNRIILLGTPIQNNLTELWLLFDFVFPGRLGTLPVFQQQFATPINMGGYANALNVQVQTGYQCAVVLRDLISPYLLRRLKSDVAQDLPKKTEMVLFVKLTAYQQDLYEKFLHSEDLGAIMRGKRNVLMGVDTLRKICNHPDLVQRDVLMHRKNYRYGDPVKLGKMQVLGPLLQMWQMQGHKTLLFCQTRQMLDILQDFVARMPTLTDSSTKMLFLRMDGLTPIGKRQALVDEFNEDAALLVFLLTTKVGGLGVNLTGADRVIIYDPDWNPSTDMQARERAWRLGQKRDITIYRLMTTGSIEEKIYHRQIFKTFLTNKILKDPKQRRFFKLNDLHDLFTLGNQDEAGTETGSMFDGAETRFGEGGENEGDGNRTNENNKNGDDFYKVAEIMGVAKLDKFQHENEQETSTEDSRIMEGIFAQNGVHLALQHDRIVDTQTHEQLIVEREANRVARTAAEALKRSRRQTRKNAVGIPTWTGRFGGSAKKIGGKPVGSVGRWARQKSENGTKGNDNDNANTNGSRDNDNDDANTNGSREKDNAKRDGPVAGRFGAVSKKNTSSQAILDGLRRKNQQAPPLPESKGNMMSKLVKYLQVQPEKSSTSNELLRHCRIALKDQKDTVLARSMLRQVCDWDARANKWRLKADYI